MDPARQYLLSSGETMIKIAALSGSISPAELEGYFRSTECNRGAPNEGNVRLINNND